MCCDQIKDKRKIELFSLWCVTISDYVCLFFTIKCIYISNHITLEPKYNMFKIYLRCCISVFYLTIHQMFIVCFILHLILSVQCIRCLTLNKSTKSNVTFSGVTSCTNVRNLVLSQLVLQIH